ncbi:MAG: sulfotransferase, partial [Alphaproteobacteria bacterium]
IELRTALSAVLARTNRVEEADAILAPLVDRFPDDPVLASQRALTRIYLGDHAGATKYAERALAIDPRLPAAHLSLALAERHSGDEARIAEMESLLAHGDIEPEGLAFLHFALAGRYETLENYRRGFDHYVAGNAAKRDLLSDRGAGYDRQAEDKAVDRIIANSPGEFFTGPSASDSELPIFIVGMPRSGTTLTEQILASHPQIGGAGELTDIGNAVRRLRDTQGYPEKPPGETALQRIAAHYLKRLREVDSKAICITDKMPGNYRNLGLIGRLFPNARVIHCRRNPIDNCLSCFVQNFGAEGLSWSFDLTDLVHQYKSYRRLMGHWRKVFPGRFLEVDYERVVADQEGQSRRLIAFTGLDWDDSCLLFHKSKRAVVTASHSQVRQPIYDTSVGRWKRYGDALAPLVDGLAEFLDEPETAED